MEEHDKWQDLNGKCTGKNLRAQVFNRNYWVAASCLSLGKSSWT